MIVYKELQSLETDLGVTAKTLYATSNNINAHYHNKSIPKSDGSIRVLSIPDEPLKKIQRAISEKLLAYEPVSIYAKAYKPASSIRKNAICHVGKEKLLKLDIYNFFDSIKYSLVKEKVFPAKKYSEQIRVLLSLLCYKGESLPQGAPTSPVISNIIMRDFDQTVGEWCEERKIRYTRYCDDMSFSGSFDESNVIKFVEGELKSLGFILNRRKTRCFTGGNKKTVTGIVVNEKINTEKSYRRQIRQEVFYCKKFGVQEHLTHMGSPENPYNYLSRLLGQINYVLQITPDNKEFLNYKVQILNILKDNQ
ncbi:MAG: RNA-directed DNA polymerase [Ruminococcaceae bacterium]|nr:RNA-directed DNA polymerase [Oscillospiraceae bacterium]